MSKHTKGPWTIYGDEKILTAHRPLKKNRTYGYDCGDDFICCLSNEQHYEYDSMNEQLANACLIAAAPEMFEVLLSLTDTVGMMLYDDDFSRALAINELNEAMEVIAKAEGNK